MNIEETPIFLLTGHLGSGKATLVNKTLVDKKGIKLAVIVNGTGEVNIDADLIETGGIVNQKDNSLVVLQNGCIRCMLKIDLVQQLSEIVSQQKFDCTIIEVSDICRPAPITQAIYAYLQTYPDFAEKGKAVFDSIVTIVDARRMCDKFSAGNDLLKRDLQEDDIENLLIQQVELCDITLLNKVDDISKEELGLVKKITRSPQPKAEIIECNYGDVDLDKILNTGDFSLDKVAISTLWIAEIEGHDDEEDEYNHHHDHDEHGHHHDEHDERHHEHHHHHHRHHYHGLENKESGEALEYDIQTSVYYARHSFNINFFDDFVARQWPKQITRCEGLCYFSNEKDIYYVFERAGRQVSLRNTGQWYAIMPPFQLREFPGSSPKLKKDWEGPYGDRIRKLVFIGQDLDKEAIAKALDTCLTGF